MPAGAPAVLGALGVLGVNGSGLFCGFGAESGDAGPSRRVTASSHELECVYVSIPLNRRTASDRACENAGKFRLRRSRLFPKIKPDVVHHGVLRNGKPERFLGRMGDAR